jgi:hypothetical protein
LPSGSSSADAVRNLIGHRSIEHRRATRIERGAIQKGASETGAVPQWSIFEASLRGGSTGLARKQSATRRK